MGRRFAVAAAVAAVVALPAVSSAQVPTHDSVAGFGLECSPICWFGVDATSGPSGEDPGGTGFYSSGNSAFFRFPEGRVTCLAVAGNEAAVGLWGPSRRFQSPPGDIGIVVVVQDDVADPEASGDAYQLVAVQDTVPSRSDCATQLPIGRELWAPGPLPLFATFTVVDAHALPASKEQCKHGGWRSYGVFKNQGDCVSFVATGGKNQPSGD